MMNTTNPAAAGCPFHTSTDSRAAYAPQFNEGIFGMLAPLRSEHPVFQDPATGQWIVTRYDDIVRIFQDRENVSSANASDPLERLNPEVYRIMREGSFSAEAILANCDTDKHTRIRGHLARLMNVRTFGALEGDIRRLVNEALDGLQGRAEADLLADFCYELPARVLFLIMGIPDADIAAVKAWSSAFAGLSFSPAQPDEQLECARQMVDYWHYCDALVQDRIQSPRDDFPSQLLALRNGDDRVMTMNELKTAVYTMIFAGHETTTSQLANTFYALLTQRSAWEAICADPSLIPGAIEEAFRFAGAVINFRRRTIKPMKLGDVTIPAKADILVSFASGNRDDQMFPDADSFDVKRANARRHLTLGNGAHVCLGAPLARLEMKIALEEFVKRFPLVRLKPGVKMDYASSLIFRVPMALPVLLT
jgi:cytochrome P450